MMLAGFESSSTRPREKSSFTGSDVAVVPSKDSVTRSKQVAMRHDRALPRSSLIAGLSFAMVLLSITTTAYFFCSDEATGFRAPTRVHRCLTIATAPANGPQRPSRHGSRRAAWRAGMWSASLRLTRPAGGERAIKNQLAVLKCEKFCCPLPVVRDRQVLFRFVQHLPSGLRHAPHRGIARADVEQT